MASFTTRSIAKTQAALKLAEVKLTAAAPTAENKSAEIVANEMRSRAPVDTGYLRSSIHVEGSQAVAGAPYAIYVEPFFAGESAHAAEPGVIGTMIAVFRTALGGL